MAYNAYVLLYPKRKGIPKSAGRKEIARARYKKFTASKLKTAIDKAKADIRATRERDRKAGVPQSGPKRIYTAIGYGKVGSSRYKVVRF